jgi:hypothetical protein
MFVTGADAGQIPHQIVAPFQRVTERLGIQNTIFFRAEHLPNYELWTIPKDLVSNINDPSPSLLKAVDEIDWPVLRVTVPGHAMGMLPHFAVIGHELGHAIQDRISIDITTRQAAADQCMLNISTRLGGLGIRVGIAERTKIYSVLTKWINELIADAVGHFIGGPAFFFALSGFLELAGQSYGISSTHPPSDLRQKLLVRELSSGTPSFEEVLRDMATITITPNFNSPHIPICPPKDTLFNELTRQRVAPFDAGIWVELVELLETLAPDIYSQTLTHLESMGENVIYTPRQLAADIDAHLDALLNLIPPIEVHDLNGVPKAAALNSIINIGWVALLVRLKDIQRSSNASIDEPSQMERLHELLLKAVELSEARMVWEEHS